MSTGVATAQVAARPRWLEGLRHRPILLVAVGFLLLLVTLIAGVAFGNVSIAPADTIAILTHRLFGWPAAQTWPQTAETIVLELRLPRVLTAMQPAR